MCVYIYICVYIYSFQNFSYYRLLYDAEGFQGGTMVKSPPANAEDASSIPGSGRSPGEGNGLPYPPPGDLPDSVIKLTSLASLSLAGRFFTTELPGKPNYIPSNKIRYWDFKG